MRLQDVDLKLLRVFRAIVDAGGISGAQALLNASQSTLSTVIIRRRPRSCSELALRWLPRPRQKVLHA